MSPKNAAPGKAKSKRAARKKISTTISPESLHYLEALIKQGEAQTLAEAVDRSIERLRKAENRRRLERDTAAYFSGLSPEAESEESEMAASLSRLTTDIDFDRES